MAIEEALDLSSQLAKANLHGSRPQHHERGGPELLRTIGHLQLFARFISARLVEAVPDKILFRAHHALTTQRFIPKVCSNIDHILVQECRAAIDEFKQLGHIGLSHVLQIRLLQAKITLTEVDKADMWFCWQDFVGTVASYLQRNRCEVWSQYKDCRLFTPQELVRLPAVAGYISTDSRLDYLGRSSVQVLYDAGLDVYCTRDSINHADALGRTILHQALSRRDKVTLNRLIDLNANPAQLCIDQVSTLHIAACHGHTRLVGWLMNKVGHLVDAPDALGRSPFWYAAENSRLHSVKLLGLRADVDIHRQDKLGLSAFASSAREGRYEVLRYLLSLDRFRKRRKALMDTTEQEIDHTPLILASQERRSECVDLILEQRSWKAGDEDFERLRALATASGDTQLLQRLELLWQIDAKEALKPSELPWPKARDPAESDPITSYTANFITDAYGSWHSTHVQSIPEQDSFAAFKDNEVLPLA